MGMLDAIEADPALASRVRAVLNTGDRVPVQQHEPEILYSTAAQYAERHAVSLRTVRSWISAGMPTVGDGRTRRVDVRGADQWRRARAGDDDSIAERARRDAARETARRCVR
jgi:hypothetical protein